MSTASTFRSSRAVAFCYKGVPCKIFKEADGCASFYTMSSNMSGRYEITDDAIIFDGCKPHEFRDMTDIEVVA